MRKAKDWNGYHLDGCCKTNEMCKNRKLEIDMEKSDPLSIRPLSAVAWVPTCSKTESINAYFVIKPR
jgi:hypothetical protein